MSARSIHQVEASVIAGTITIMGLLVVQLVQVLARIGGLA